MSAVIIAEQQARTFFLKCRLGVPRCRSRSRVGVSRTARRSYATPTVESSNLQTGSAKEKPYYVTTPIYYVNAGTDDWKREMDIADAVQLHTQDISTHWSLPMFLSDGMH